MPDGVAPSSRPPLRRLLLRVGLILLLVLLPPFLGLIGLQIWCQHRAAPAVEALARLNLAPLLAAPDVPLETLAPIRTQDGNAAEDLIRITGTRGKKRRAPTVHTSKDVWGAMTRAGRQRTCRWYAPGLLDPGSDLFTMETINYGGLRAAAKFAHGEAVTLAREGRFREAEARLQTILSVGQHLRNSTGTLMQTMLGFSIEQLAAKELPLLYRRWGRPDRNTLAARYQTDLEAQQRGTQAFIRVITGAASTTGEGVRLLDQLLRHEPIARIWAGEITYAIAMGWVYSPMEVVFGLAPFRGETLRTLTTSSWPDLQARAGAALGTVERLTFVNRMSLWAPYLTGRIFP